MKIGVIDYGMGNLHSVSKALALTGARVTVSDSKAVLRASDMLVLPGVGSFGAAAANLAKKGLVGMVGQWIDDDRPFLGICLGLQLLFERSEESPRARGLGIFEGDVVKFRSKRLQIPHMGWNTAAPQQKNSFGIGKSDYFYFVHSYFPEPGDKNIVFTRTDYGRGFCSAVAKNNLVATQFHSEKSGAVGQRFLKNVVKELKEAA